MPPRMASDFETLFDAGSECVKRGDFLAARDYFKEACLLDPDHKPTIALLEKLDLLAPPSEELVDEDDDEDEDLEMLTDAELLQAAAPRAEAPAPRLAAKPAAEMGVKEEMDWDDAPSGAPSSDLPPGSKVAVIGGETPIGRRVLSALASESSLESTAFGASYSAAAAKAFEDASAVVFVSASAGGSGGVEPSSMKALLRALPTNGLKRLVLLSSVGVDRTDRLPFNLANVFGQLDKVRAMEQELQLVARRVAASCSVVRVGKLSDAAQPAVCALAPGDAFEGETSSAAVASLLVQSLSSPECVNATFSAGPTLAGSDVTRSWDDELIKLVGPEIFRRPFRNPSSTESVLGWLRKWARALLEPGSGLSSPIDVVDVPGGVLVRFIKQSGAGYADMDRPETADDKWAAAQGADRQPPTSDGALLLLAEAQPEGASARVRVRRAEMGDGAVPKDMSEKAVLEKLGRDLTSLDKARAR